jgi:TRAP-type C4-dicarboxylate transport system permease large subunit
VVAFLGVVVTAFAIAYTQVLRGHIRVEFVVMRLPPRAQAGLTAFIWFLSFILFALLAWQSVEYGLSLLARDFFANLSSYSLTVIPMFIFMGSIAYASGMSRRLYEAGYTVFGQMRGGLAMATIAACAGFAAMCGSTNATAAAMGRVSLPEMRRYHYDDSLATGCVAAAGSLGIMLAGLFITVVVILCKRNPNLAPGGAPTTFKQKLAGLAGIIEILVLFALVIGGLFLGWFSPTQAGAAGAGGALITLTVPIIYPVVLVLNFDPIWFGVIIVLVTEMGVITPPVGLNVYVIKGVAEDVPLESIFKGILPFLAAIIVAVIILMIFPQIATFLPGLTLY